MVRIFIKLKIANEKKTNNDGWVTSRAHYRCSFSFIRNSNVEEFFSLVLSDAAIVISKHHIEINFWCQKPDDFSNQIREYVAPQQTNNLLRYTRMHERKRSPKIIHRHLRDWVTERDLLLTGPLQRNSIMCSWAAIIDSFFFSQYKSWFFFFIFKFIGGFYLKREKTKAISVQLICFSQAVRQGEKTSSETEAIRKWNS